jgi:hypothetical protein
MKSIHAFFADNRHCNLSIPNFRELPRFDNVEVSPVFILRAENGRFDYERTDAAEMAKHPDIDVMYSVYLHYDVTHPDNRGLGGATCIGDFPTEKVAQAFADFIAKLLASYQATQEQK